MSSADVATTLYGSTPAVPAQPADTTPNVGSGAAPPVPGEPAEIAAALDRNAEGRLYGDSASVTGRRLAPLLDANYSALNSADKAAVDSAVGRAARFAGLSEHDAPVIERALAETAQLDASQQEALQAKAWTELRAQHGDRLEELMTATRRFIARDARLATWLDRSGVGNHPAVANLFIERMQSARLRGTFQ